MDFRESVKTCLVKNYINFNGRAPRSELWFYLLFLFIVNMCLSLGTLLIPYLFVVLYYLFNILTILPSVAVWVRRLHDINRDGAWVLLLLVPVIGQILIIIWGCERGTEGSNRFGPDPLPIK